MSTKKRAGRTSRKAVSLFLAIVLVVLSLSVFPVSAVKTDTVTVTAKYQKGHLASGDSFVVTVYPEDPSQMQSVALSGLEYSFSYDTSLFSADAPTRLSSSMISQSGELPSAARAARTQSPKLSLS